jgi:hypothetical protein
MGIIKATANQKTILFFIILAAFVMIYFTYKESFAGQLPSFPLTTKFTPPNEVYKRY